MKSKIEKCNHPKPWQYIDWGSDPVKFKCKQCGEIIDEQGNSISQ